MFELKDELRDSTLQTIRDFDKKKKKTIMMVIQQNESWDINETAAF